MSIIIPISIIEGLKNNVLTIATSELNRGIQVTHDEISLSDPIVILNPKEFNIFYRSRYDKDNILLNYRTAPGVTAEEYILDGEDPQSLPLNNIIQTPEMGNHSLMLTGKNSTGGPCTSKLVSFYIGSTVRGVLGAAPERHDFTYESTVHVVTLGNIHGLVTDTEFEQEIFLEGPQTSLIPTSYTKKIDLVYEAVLAYVPFIILRSEPWYHHCVEVVNSHWINLVRDGEIVRRLWVRSGTMYNATGGETDIIYFLVDLLHVFGNVTYWNDETRYYDVINIGTLSYFNTYCVSYSANESILQYPILGPVDFSQFSGTYHDKNLTKNQSWGWQTNEDWIKSYGVEVSVFLGNYAGINSCPVPVRFTLPQPNIQNNELIPDELIHTFTRTGYEPETYGANYRGLENTFSLNIIPI